MKAAVPFRCVAAFSVCPRGALVVVFTRAGGLSVRCFGGKTLRGSRNSIMRMLRRPIARHVLFTAFQWDFMSVFRPGTAALVRESAHFAQRVRDSSPDMCSY